MTTQVVKLNQVTLGQGQPKIAVPLTGRDQAAVLAQAEQAVAAQPDLIEWRLDYYQAILDAASYRATATKLLQLLGPIPLLTTFRTQAEGGAMALTTAAYASIYQQVIADQLTAALDIELFLPAAVVKPLVAAAHAAGIAVIMSSHDFEKTPPQAEIVQRLTQMVALGADVAKIAVMPQSAVDVATLLSATAVAHQQLAVPLITMAMGELGKVSRISGQVFGSALTFGTVGAASAPGQIELKTLRQQLQALTLAD
ncbi:type I 3-dehydroquinate dehydratase [Loigolactobacillus binensis]|uniref:3-dehydroquinate dehydratase n=1 Tax=Loigolactobacillus binensis TaxID=2559922 RepID=A0ABW3EBV0_9LACO|nr:type I 3-dehydroquinate dehydratase [Loigolactobacillus binensis]